MFCSCLQVFGALCKELHKNNPMTACEHTLNDLAVGYGDDCVAFHGAVAVVTKHDLGMESNPRRPNKQCAVLGN